MPVLKNDITGSAAKNAIVLDMGDLRRQADQLRQVAQTQAMRIVQEANEQAAQIAEQARKQAFEQGYQEGFEKGEVEGQTKGHAQALDEHRQQFEQLRATWLAAFEEWNGQREAMETDAREAILRLGLLFGEKIVHRVVDIDKTVVIHQLTESLSYVLKPTSVAVKINPADRPLIDDAMPQLLAKLSHLERVRVDDDHLISPGGCIIDFGKGRIDSTIEKQIERLVNAMLPDGPTVHALPVEPLVSLGAPSEVEVELPPDASPDAPSDSD